MAIGERIHFFRLLRGMTQKYLGMALGFPEKSADVRLAQYETGSEPQRQTLPPPQPGTGCLAPCTLRPGHRLLCGLMHTLFTLEDNYGLKISEMDGEVCLKVDVRKSKDTARLHEMLCSWQQAAAMLEAGEITQEDYDRWRYHYPEFDTSGYWHKVTPSQELSDMLVEDFNDKIGE